MSPQWEKCLEILKTKISEAVFSDLFSSLTLASVSDRRVLVVVPPGKDPKAILPYKGLVELSWQEATGNKADFDFQRQLEKPQAVTAPPSKFGYSSVPLSQNYRFDNFVPGDKAQMMDEVHAAVEKGDNKALFIALHTMKGVCANMGLDGIYGICAEMTELARHEAYDLALVMLP